MAVLWGRLRSCPRRAQRTSSRGNFPGDVPTPSNPTSPKKQSPHTGNRTGVTPKYTRARNGKAPPSARDSRTTCPYPSSSTSRDRQSSPEPPEPRPPVRCSSVALCSPHAFPHALSPSAPARSTKTPHVPSLPSEAHPSRVALARLFRLFRLFARRHPEPRGGFAC